METKTMSAHQKRERIRDAAPELLEALRRCVECLNGPVSDRLTGDDLATAGVYGALVQAGAAIAKAGA